MALVGVVKEIKGEVKVIAADGSERFLEKGDKVYGDEQIITGLIGSVSIEFSGGINLEIGRDSNITLNNEFLNTVGDAKSQEQTDKQAADQVAEMQQGLVEGDSIEDLPEPAAGNTPDTVVQAENEGSGFVEVTKETFKTDSLIAEGKDFGVKRNSEVSDSSITELILNPLVDPVFASIESAQVVINLQDDNVIHNHYSFESNADGNADDNLPLSASLSAPSTRVVEVKIPVLSLFDNDQDGSSLELVSVSNPQNGTVKIGAGEDEGFVIFTHEVQVGSNQGDLIGFFDYTATNGSQTDKALVKVTFEDDEPQFNTDDDGIVSSTLSVENGASQTLLGTEGDDIIISYTNGDILIGGSGDDQLTGGDGSDGFIWRSGDDQDALSVESDGIATDTIFDFDGAGGDTIEIGDLLEGDIVSGEDLGAKGYISFEVVGGTTTLSIDVDGADGEAAVTQEIILDGVALAEGAWFSLGGADADTLIINSAPIAIPEFG